MTGTTGGFCRPRVLRFLTAFAMGSPWFGSGRSGRANASTGRLILAQLHHNGRLLAAHQLLDMIRPALQRARDRSRVVRPVVDAGNAGTMTAEVVQHRLDVMRLNAKVSHAGGDGAPDVVQLPGSAGDL